MTVSEEPTWSEDVLRSALASQGFACPGALPEVTWFGDSPEMAAELGELVRNGRKRATASLLWCWEDEQQEPPVSGEQWIVVDWEGRALAVVEVTEVVVRPFEDVDGGFARDEGEGDGSLDHWRAVHQSFFERECSKLGRPMTIDAPVVCVRFRLVHAGPPAG